MEANPANNAQAASSGAAKKWHLALIDAVGLWYVARYELHHHSPWVALWGVLLAFSLADALFPDQMSTFTRGLFGKIEYLQVSSPPFEQRIQSRYRTQINELTSLGFSYLFSEGEAFSIARVLLLYPALVLLLMKLKGEVVTVSEGKFLTGNPILVSGDRTAYGHPNGLGVIFHTRFEDGSRLISANYGEDDTRSGLVRQAVKGASISETWSRHRQTIQSLTTESNRVKMEISFPAYVDIIRQA